MKGFIVYPTYKIEGNRADVYLFGRLEDGRSFRSVHSFRPYFYVPTKLAEKAKRLLPNLEFTKSDFVNFSREPVTLVVGNIPKDVPAFRKTLQDEGIPCYEADVRYAIRFLIDHKIKGMVRIEGKESEGEGVDVVFDNPVLHPALGSVPLKVLSFDIETDMKAKQVYAISLYGEHIEKVLIVAAAPVKGAEHVPTEAELVKRFVAEVVKYDPDVIVGWNCIDFDLQVLKKSAVELKVPFLLGRLPWEVQLRLAKSFFMDSSADIAGRMLLDGISVLKSAFIRLPDYKLETAAKHFLGTSKLLEGKQRFSEIERLYKEDKPGLAAYNLKDSKLVYDIFYKSGILELTVSRSLLTRMPLDRVSASIASLDSLYLEALQERKVVAPTAYVQEREERIKGGYVMASKPGIYDNVLVFDFKSLYPSIIRTFNIDPWSFVPEKERNMERDKVIVAPNGAWFRRERGILPELIEYLWRERDKAKKVEDKVKANAVKILMNSFFGVLANPACRFYSIEMANAITHFGQDLIKRCAAELAKDGHEVIYGDTDSLFVNTPATSETDALQDAAGIARQISAFLNEYITTTYKRECFLELEFEKLYHRFFLPRIRASDTGAKKRYAGLLKEGGKEHIQFVGLESVRRDWTALAKQFQEKLLWRVFHDKSVESWIKEFVGEVRAGKYNEQLVYRKSIRKKVSEYTKTTPPHIQAARKAGLEAVGIIDYVMTIDGPEVVESGGKIDYEHYIEKQLRPIAESVLQFFDLSFDELLQGHKQATLGSF